MLLSRIRFFSAVVSRHSPAAAADRASACGRGVLLRPVLDVPVAVPVEQKLVGADQERARAAGRVEQQPASFVRPACRASCPFASSLPDRVLDDVIDDVGGRVVDAAGLLTSGFSSTLPGAAGQPDHLAQELLVDLAEDFGRQHGELVRAVGDSRGCG